MLTTMCHILVFRQKSAGLLTATRAEQWTCAEKKTWI